MIKCCVYGCLNSITNSDPSLQFYFFPKHPVIAQEWMNACCIWRAEDVDLNTARVCSIHFDSNSYTSEYKMVDYLGVYTKVLKYDAVPTLYVPQQTVVMLKPPVEPQPAAEIKQIIVYGVAAASQDQPFDPSYGSNSLIVENHGQQVATSSLKYEELRNVPTGQHPRAGNLETKKEMQVENESPENSEIYRNITTFKQYQDLELENEKLKRELINLKQSTDILRCKLNEKTDCYKKADIEYNRLFKMHSLLERKSMSVGDQKNLLSKVFSESQIKILSGKKKIYWSNDDMAIGYTIRHMSSKRCYMYLSKNLNIPLPALSSIKRWQTLKKGEFVKDMLEKDDRNEDSDE